MEAGNVWPFSQISTSFLIFSYEQHACECSSAVKVRKKYEYANQDTSETCSAKSSSKPNTPGVCHGDPPWLWMVPGTRSSGVTSPRCRRACSWESDAMFSAYLLIFWRRGKDVVHQNGDQFCYSMHACSGGPIWRREAWGLSLGFGLVQPFPRYRVYYVEYSQFVCAGCFLEVGEELLDEDRFVLQREGDTMLAQRSVGRSLRRLRVAVAVCCLPGHWRHRVP